MLKKKNNNKSDIRTKNNDIKQMENEMDASYKMNSFYYYYNQDAGRDYSYVVRLNLLKKLKIYNL